MRVFPVSVSLTAAHLFPPKAYSISGVHNGSPPSDW
jgi:hypothetical protein